MSNIVNNPNNKCDPTKLIPLIKAEYTLIPLRGNDKAPRDKRWTIKPYTDFDPIKHMKEGNNVGVRLTETDLVIDVDPRNYKNYQEGDDPLEKFALTFRIDLSKLPTVNTGGGGFHFYLKKDKSLSVVNSLKEWPGFEFKTKGQQVVAPGSIHPEKRKLYSWDVFNDDPSLAPMIPDALIELISKGKINPPHEKVGIYSSEEIGEMLSALNPENFRDHEEWFKLMCSCHHASNGQAKLEFIDWSIGDNVYSDQTENIGNRWDSLCSTKGNSISYRYLLKILKESGFESLIKSVNAQDDFKGIEAENYQSTIPNSNILENDSPMTIAKAMLKDTTYLRFNGGWYEHDNSNGIYNDVKDELFDSFCWNWINGKEYNYSKGSELQIKKLVATKNLIMNVQDAAKAIRQGPKEMPEWLNKTKFDLPPIELMVCANGLLHLPTRNLMASDERFFSLNGSPVNYNPDAPKPYKWLKFLDEVFPEEQDCIDTLQEAMGYFLTQDTSLQKIIQFVGPSRAGKGVFTRILQMLIGKGNYTSPTPKQLSGTFGLQPLLGKQLAVISDLRMGKETSRSSLAEIFLNISGEDEVSVSQKYKDAFEVKLNTRFLLVSNEVLHIGDTSGALGNRMIVIKAKQSFLNKEDPELTTKLSKELPGILLWALDGLDRLKERGFFLQPQSNQDEIELMKKLASPVKWYLENEVMQNPALSIKKEDFFDGFYEWYTEEGINYSGGKSFFFKDLNSAGANFLETRPRINGERVSVLKGVDLKKEYQNRKLNEARRDFYKIEE